MTCPMRVRGQPVVIVPATTQTPKAIIPVEIRNESTESMSGPFFIDRRTSLGYTLGPT
jgi:hypothetical protein